jgi:hypothetical protein
MRPFDLTNEDFFNQDGKYRLDIGIFRVPVVTNRGPMYFSVMRWNANRRSVVVRVNNSSSFLRNCFEIRKSNLHIVMRWNANRRSVVVCVNNSSSFLRNCFEISKSNLHIIYPFLHHFSLGLTLVVVVAHLQRNGFFTKNGTKLIQIECKEMEDRSWLAMFFFQKHRILALNFWLSLFLLVFHIYKYGVFSQILFTGILAIVVSNFGWVRGIPLKIESEHLPRDRFPIPNDTLSVTGREFYRNQKIYYWAHFLFGYILFMKNFLFPNRVWLTVFFSMELPISFFPDPDESVDFIPERLQLRPEKKMNLKRFSSPSADRFSRSKLTEPKNQKADFWFYARIVLDLIVTNAKELYRSSFCFFLANSLIVPMLLIWHKRGSLPDNWLRVLVFAEFFMFFLLDVTVYLIGFSIYKLYRWIRFAAWNSFKNFYKKNRFYIAVFALLQLYPGSISYIKENWIPRLFSFGIQLCYFLIQNYYFLIQNIERLPGYQILVQLPGIIWKWIREFFK